MAVYPDPQALAELGELLAARHGNEILSADVAFGELTLTIHAKGIVGLVKALIDNPAARFARMSWCPRSCR